MAMQVCAVDEKCPPFQVSGEKQSLSELLWTIAMKMPGQKRKAGWGLVSARTGQ